MSADGAHRRRSLAVISGILALTFLDTTVVSVALGSVQSSLHAGVSGLQWVVDGYALAFASLMLTGGTLGDRFGRKRIMLVGVAIFAAASFLGAMASSLDAVIAARVLMGVGAACSEPGTLSVLRHVFPKSSSRAKALGVWAGVSCLGLAAGPVIGGILVGIWDWRAVFWFNVLVGSLLLLAGHRYLPESSDPAAAKVDVPGQLFAVATLATVSIAVIQGEAAGFANGGILLLFCLGALSGLLFVGIELRSPSPMLDLRYFHKLQFTSALTVAFAIYFGTFSIFFFTALYLEEVVGYSAFRIALVFVPMAALMVIGAAISSRRIARAGGRWTLTTGSVMAAIGIGMSEPCISVHPDYLALTCALALTGFGFGVAIVPVTSTVLEVVPAEHSGMAASATNAARQLGVVLGVAVLGALVNAHLTADLSTRLQRLGIPANFQSIVINAVERGTVPSGGNAPGSTQSYGGIVNRVISAAYTAFHDGLGVALLTSAVLIAVAAVVAGFAAAAAPRTDELEQSSPPDTRRLQRL